LLDKAHGPLASQKEEARPQSAVPTELACKAQSHVAVQAEEEARPQSHAAVQAEEACKAQSHVAVQAEEEARPQSHAAVQAEEACTAQSHVAVQAEEALPVECSYEMDPTEADPEFSGVMSPPLAPSPSSSSSCEAEVRELQVAPASSLRRARQTSFSSSEVPISDVPKQQAEVSETHSALGQGGNGNKKTVRPEYVNLIRLTSKMKKEAERRVPSKDVNLSQEDSSSVLRTSERMVGGRRLQSDKDRLRNAMRLFPRKKKVTES